MSASPMKVAENFTGRPGVYVKLEETVRGVGMIIDGELDHVPEQAFYMAGAIEEVLERSRQEDAIQMDESEA